MNVKRLLAAAARRVDRELNRILPARGPHASRLYKAMRYSVFAGGKRVRPFLVLEGARLAGGRADRALPLACAVEMIHTYSLIHDDLPSMDDDAERRGKPTCHIRFDEATAILAGDALLTQAFEVMAAAPVDKRRAARVAMLVARATGPRGMVGGQAADLGLRNKKTDLRTLNAVNGLKTAELIAVCVEAGTIWGGGSPAQAARAARYGKNIGFLFQVVDDIIDRDGYAALAGVTAAYQKAARLRDAARRELKNFGPRAAVLSAFADFLYERKK